MSRLRTDRRITRPPGRKQEAGKLQWSAVHAALAQLPCWATAGRAAARGSNWAPAAKLALPQIEVEDEQLQRAVVDQRRQRKQEEKQAVQQCCFGRALLRENETLRVGQCERYWYCQVTLPLWQGKSARRALHRHWQLHPLGMERQTRVCQ